MAKKVAKKAKASVEEPEMASDVVEMDVTEGSILPVSVDMGREDLNTMARKLNEVIVKINSL